MAESIIQFLRQANPLALNIDFNEKFQLLRKQKIAAAAAAATAKGGLGPKSLPVMKQVMQKRPLGTAQDGTIKKARVDPQSKPSSSNRPPVRRKSTGAAGPQPPPQQQQQLQQPKQTVNPQQGQPEQQTSQPLQAQQASQSHQAQQASQPQQASAASTTTTKPEGTQACRSLSLARKTGQAFFKYPFASNRKSLCFFLARKTREGEESTSGRPFRPCQVRWYRRRGRGGTARTGRT